MCTHRIRSETDGWCPLNKVSSTTDEYIQIDLGNLTVITLIELQGRYSLKPVREKKIEVLYLGKCFNV